MNNSEILYIYDAKLANPNGDPDEENRPRMDNDINLVSDLRIKRYIRDYLLDRNYKLFVQRMGDKPVTAEERMKELKDKQVEEILDSLIDVRLFGATMPIKGDTKTFIGPVQFNWGYSLNKVELLESSITSHFSSESGNTQGAIGKDYRVKYSLIAFSGVVSGKRAIKTRLKSEDVDLLDQALKKSIQEQITRSKIGQYPRLYIRVEYKDDETILGDMRSKVKLKENADNIRDIKDFSIDITLLANFLKENKKHIETIHYYWDKELNLVFEGEKVSLEEIFKEFNLSKI